jgi:hypothetical protein
MSLAQIGSLRALHGSELKKSVLRCSVPIYNDGNELHEHMILER